MFISQFMTKDVVTLGRESDIAEARKLMRQYRIRHIPVTDSDGTLIGIVSDRDIRSAMPSSYFNGYRAEAPDAGNTTGILVQDIMTKDPVSISLASTIQDLLLLMEKARVGAFPVLDENFKLAGIVSDRDLLNAFIEVLGIKEPGALLGIVVEEKLEEMERLIHAIVTENIAFGSILVFRQWGPGKRAVFPYLFAKNVANLKKKLRNLGYDVLDPVEWYVEKLH
ncbi:MAG: CBS domain-containing protein [Desulfosarcina sp.]|jgi:acetoin utilization protein AcuB